MGKFLRHVGALLRRNFIYRKRTWISSIFQLLLPCATIVILVIIKEALKDTSGFKPTEVAPVFPSTDDAWRPLSFTDYITAIKHPRTCVERPFGPDSFDPDLRGIDYWIDGIDIRSWSVPFVKCNAKKCENLNDDATQHCEYHTLAIVGKGSEGTTRKTALVNYIKSTYNDIDTMINTVTNGQLDYSIIREFDSTKDLDEYIKHKDYGALGRPKVAIAVVVGGSDPYEYDYTIRTNSTNFNSQELTGRPIMPTQPTTKQTLDSFAKRANDVCSLEPGTPDIGSDKDNCIAQYIYNGAIPIQRLVNDWIISETGAAGNGFKVAENGVSFVDFPAKKFVEDGFYSTIAPYAPLLLVLGLLYPVAATIRSVVAEKELRQKELMKMMSISEAAIGFSWFLSFFLFFFFSGLFVTIVSSILYPSSSFMGLLFFWELAFIAIILYAMTVAAFFSKSTRATLIGILVFFIGYFLTLISNYDTGARSTIGLISLHPVAAISYGIQVIGSLEDAGVGVNTDTFSYSDVASGYSFTNAIVSLIFDIILWSLWCWYYTRVIPGDYGQALPWYFPFTGAYWCSGGSKNKNNTSEDDDDNEETEERDPLVPIEEVSAALKEQEKDGKGVHIKGLTKQFGEKTAVDGLNLSMYSGQVFALLGHNGAGKTTTINMLTGMLSTTSGTAYVNGKNINTEMSSVRESVGICLQHDCLFPMLTVTEHIQFFARAKGLYEDKSKDEAEESIQQTIQDVALLDKRNTFSQNLSGGMKRKLSLAIAFCGDSKVVFLDEPTSGMDTFSRRFTWNVIRQNRTDRCIILTTHFMDEADLLGDQIGIMAEGQLRCCGSSMFLKKHYGVGYQISVEKNSDGKDKQGLVLYDNIDSKLENIVTGSVSDATILSNVGADMIFQLPISSSDKFVGIFQELDALVDNGEIATYGVGITTLDEVFLMVARGETGTKDNLRSSTLGLEAAAAAPEITETSNKSYRSANFDNEAAVFATHAKSLLSKRATYFKRDKKAWLCSTILPSFFALWGFVLVAFISPNRNMPNLELKLDDFNKDIKGSNRQPVTFGTADEFQCQPGICVAQSSMAHSADGLFCGGASSLPFGSTCHDTAVATSIPTYYGDDETTVISQAGSTVLESSETLLANPDNLNLKASQYGALYFTYDTSTTVYENTTEETTFVQAAQQLCANSAEATASGVNCALYNGIGYLVSTNFTSYHGSLLFQSLADEAIVRTALSSDKYKIKTSIHPLPITNLEGSFAESADSFSAWFLLVLSFPFITGTFATFIVQERMSKAKHLQTVAGVKPEAYWFSTYLWDILNYQLPMWIVVILMYIFGIDAFITSDRQVASGTIVTLLLFGPAAAGFTYIISFFFKSPSNCNMFVIVLNFFIGLAGSMTVFILRLIHAGQVFDGEESNLKSIAIGIEWILRIFPSFSFAKALLFATNIDVFATIAASRDMTVWSKDIMLYDIIVLAFQSVLYIWVAIWIDKLSTKPKVVQAFNTFFKCKCSGNKGQGGEANDNGTADDEDVAAETERILSGEANDEKIIIDTLVKEYPNGKRAVNGLSLGIPSGQCFGLLGINGAGKTTTMAMLTAEFPPTSGDASLAGYSVTNNPEETRRQIGYCPQFDAHFMNLTGREHVRLYAAIKGVPSDVIDEAVSSKLQEVGLNPFDSDRVSSKYSGGMQRKLSVACATIGNPQIVFLDEPSTGMDPVSRRDLWKVISNMVVGSEDQDPSERTSVILTTHSMEECEALCPRIGIMAGGKLRCLGSAQHLKTRFGNGFQIELKVKQASESDDDVVKTLMSILGSAGKTGGGDDPEAADESDSIFLNLDESIAAVKNLTGDDYLADKITVDDPAGYVIFKSAESDVGVTAKELAAFCATELRIRQLFSYFETEYPDSILREREETKIRFEVPSAGVKISSAFESIEENKEKLFVADYGISQTTLEQVFNMHAAEAELAKQGLNDIA